MIFKCPIFPAGSWKIYQSSGCHSSFIKNFLSLLKSKLQFNRNILILIIEIKFREKITIYEIKKKSIIFIGFGIVVTTKQLLLKTPQILLAKKKHPKLYNSKKVHVQVILTILLRKKPMIRQKQPLTSHRLKRQMLKQLNLQPRMNLTRQVQQLIPPRQNSMQRLTQKHPQRRNLILLQVILQQLKLRNQKLMRM